MADGGGGKRGEVDVSHRLQAEEEVRSSSGAEEEAWPRSEAVEPVDTHSQSTRAATQLKTGGTFSQTDRPTAFLIPSEEVERVEEEDGDCCELFLL